MSMRNRIRCPKCHEKLSYSAYKRHTNPLYNCKPSNSRFPEETASPDVTVELQDEGNVRDTSAEIADQLDPDVTAELQDEGDTSAEIADQLDSHEEDVAYEWNVESLENSDEELNSENPAQDDELQVVDDIDVIEQDLFPQEEDSVSRCKSAPLSSSVELLISDHQAADVHEDNTETYLSSLVLQPLAISLIFFQLVYKVSDRGIEFILMLFHSFIKIIAQCANNEKIQFLLVQLPKNIYKLRKIFGHYKKEFDKFAVCPKCSACHKIPSSASTNLTCSAKSEFSKKTCGAELLRKVKCGKKYKFVPKKIYIYSPLKLSLSRLFQKKEFITDIEKWRTRVSECNVLSDVYDGNIWKELSSPGQFLSTPFSLALRLNIDWFRIYKHVNYSVGLVYLVIENLPRHKRFNLENIIIVGCIPGPNEPKLTVNSFLKPLIDELLELWHGVFIKSQSAFGFTSVRCMLTSISADIPATRKLCGFFSHNARRGCSKCLKEFVTDQFNSKPDFSGFDNTSWISRDHLSHMHILNQIMQKKLVSERKEIQKAWGVRHSELVRLPYLDLIRYHVVDPMHNLLLGTAKYMMSVWKDESLISKSDYQNMQDTVDRIRVPVNIGRIPHKVESQVSSLTADQWKNWVLIYSIPALCSILPREHLECWSLFVTACSLILKPIINIDDVIKGDDKITQFCKCYEQLYGKSKCTPNMHLHLHLKQCLLDYGPVHSFWCFPFERFNGIFESFNKNWICPELQIMTKFLNYQESVIMSKLSSELPHFEWLGDINDETSHKGSIQQTSTDPNLLNAHSRFILCPIEEINATNSLMYEAVSKKCEKLLLLHEVEWLRNVYMALYPTSTITHVNMSHDVFNEANIFGEIYLSVKAKGNHSHSIIAYWPESIQGTSELSRHCEYRAGEIQYFFHHMVGIILPEQPEKSVSHVFAYVHWYEKHPCYDGQLFPLKVFTNIKKKTGASVFIPLSRIINQCAEFNSTMKFDFGIDNVLVLCPINRKVRF